jgi:outer membrane protein OmpA-like peptidoglycan-associated protein
LRCADTIVVSFLPIVRCFISRFVLNSVQIRRSPVPAKAEQDALRAKEEAARAEAERNRKAAEALRAQLLEQFNRILPTTDTPRGLKVNMADVLFDTGKYDLRPPAREALAKLSGIVLAHPGLKLEVEGYTDSVGSETFNQQLSEQRATTVRQYLIAQGLPENSISSRGFGETAPIASNDTPQGRQQNRRVEIIVSGQVIGTKIGEPGSR